MQSAYKAICKDNQYLYAQLEQLTMLMGHAQVHGLNDRYKEYSEAKEKIRQRIEANLDRLVDLWDMSVREAHRIAEWRENTTADKVINLYLTSETKNIKAIATAVNISETKASRIITNYLTKKYDEVA